jgi:PAS domain S-box-containing protein
MALDAIVTVDEVGRVTEWNPAAERSFGYTRQEALGRRVGELIVPPASRKAHRAGLRRAVASPRARPHGRRFELEAMRRGGGRFPVELTVTRTQDAPPRITAWIRDLTEQRAAEAEAERRRVLLERAEELAQIGSWRRDLRTREGVWSDGMYRIHGLPPSTAAPSVDAWLAYTHPDDRGRLRTFHETVVERPDEVGESPIDSEYRAIRPDGSVRTVRFLARVEADGADEHAVWAGVAQDVTDQRLTERELFVQYAVGQALRESDSVDEGSVGLLRRVGTALDYPVGTLWTYDEDRQRIVARAFWAAANVEVGEFEALTRDAVFRVGQGIPGRVWMSGQPAVAAPLYDNMATQRRKAARGEGLQSGLAFAAVADGSTVAVLSFYGFDPRTGDERLMRGLTHLGRQLGPFLARRRDDPGPRALTKRELEVLRLAAEGVTGPQIAERLFISPATVKTHFEHIYEKLAVGDRAAAVAHALRTGLIR